MLHNSLAKTILKYFLGACAGLIICSCASKQTEAPTVSTAEYEVINDFYKRAHLPLYHKTVQTSLPGSLSNYDSIYIRKRYPELSSDQVLENLLTPEILSQVQQKLEDSEELRFEQEYLEQIVLSGKKSESFMISRPIVLDSLAIIRQIGITNDPVFILKKGPEGDWELRFTFFEEIPED